MKVNGKYARDIFKNGDIVWACAYDKSESKEANILKQLPIKGKLMVCRTDEATNKILNIRPNISVAYFVPFKKNGTDLAWSKAVRVNSRMYATTYEESVEQYNDKIESYINWYKENIKDLENDRITAGNEKEN